MLSVENLTYHYKGRPAVLKDVNFNVNTGEFLAILGNNGVGKSTMLKCFNKIHTPDGGKIILDDLFSGKQTEINIPIAPDGSFSAKIPTCYPIQQKLIFGNRYIPFYIEPTDTLYIETYLDELFAPYRYSGEIEQNCVHSTYRGRNARITFRKRKIG